MFSYYNNSGACSLAKCVNGFFLFSGAEKVVNFDSVI